MTYAEIVLWALGIWGWSGIPISVQEEHLGWGVAAVSYPEDGFKGCTIVINLDNEPIRSINTTILHEVGHCLGYWPLTVDGSPHNQIEQHSVMYAPPVNGDNVTVTSYDRLRLYLTRLGKMPFKAYAPLIMR